MKPLQYFLLTLIIASFTSTQLSTVESSPENLVAQAGSLSPANLIDFIRSLPNEETIISILNQLQDELVLKMTLRLVRAQKYLAHLSNNILSHMKLDEASIACVNFVRRSNEWVNPRHMLCKRCPLFKQEYLQWVLPILESFVGEKITNLYLGHCQLKSLPKEISLLVNLEKLYLSFNELTELPNSIFQLSNLRELDPGLLH